MFIAFLRKGLSYSIRQQAIMCRMRKVVPEKIEPITDLIEKIVNEKVELRLHQIYNPIRNRVIGSTLDFSVIRFKNAGKLPNR